MRGSKGYLERTHIHWENRKTPGKATVLPTDPEHLDEISVKRFFLLSGHLFCHWKNFQKAKFVFFYQQGKVEHPFFFLAD